MQNEAATARSKCAELRAQRDAAADERKSLWRREQQLNTAARAMTSDLEKAQRSLQHSMPRAQWDAVAAVSEIAREKKVTG